MKRKVAAIIVFAVLFALGGCHSKKRISGGSGTNKVERPVVRPKLPAVTGSSADSNDAALVTRLIDGAYSWIGTPYRYGGAERSGADCSGFLQRLFADVAAVSLPRNSRKQAEYCRPVARERLQPGDLVFFNGSRIGGDIGHVGLYIGNDRMIHASSSRGVIESAITERYYMQRYCGGGRVAAITYAARGTRPGTERELPREKPVRKVPEAVAEITPDFEPVQPPAVQSAPANDAGHVISEPAEIAERHVVETVVESRISALVDSAFAAAARTAAAEPDTVCSEWMD